MAGSKSDYAEALELNMEYGDPASVIARPAQTYIGLYTARGTDAQADAGTNFTEVSTTGTAYSRIQLVQTTANWVAVSGADPVKRNVAEIAWPAATGAGFGTVIGFFITVSGSNFADLLHWGDLAGVPKNFIGTASDDLITSTAHGYADTTKVRVEALPGTALPTGIAAGTDYFVRDATANTFKLALTSGGAAIDLTANGMGIVYTWNPKIVAATDVFKFPADSISIYNT